MALSKAMYSWPLFRSSITPESVSSGVRPTLTVRPHSDSFASALKHLAYLGSQVPGAPTSAELPRRGNTLIVSDVGAVGAGERAMPVLVPGGCVTIVALGCACWVWDVDRGDGKAAEAKSWASAGRRTWRALSWPRLWRSNSQSG
jgi:2-oxoisovalerate dehydrogenase E2 component (dihydrolipoyl transacylase)